MNFLIDLLKKATMGDNFRIKATPVKYNDKIAQLNTTSNNQFDRLTTNRINQLQKTGNSVLTQTDNKGTILPGSK
jgi:hypothetical protein